MTDVLTLLSEADPVRAEDLAPLDLPVLGRRRASTRLILVAAAAVLAAGAAASIVVFATGGRSPHAIEGTSSQPGVIGPRGSMFPVLANPCGQPNPLKSPLGACRGRGGPEPIPLALAPAMLHAPVVLPDNSFVNPAGVGAVQGASEYGQSAVGVAFPAQGLVVEYMRPAIPDPLSNFQVAVRNSQGSLIYLSGGVPALAESQRQDGSNWGFVQFVAGGTTIVVMGHPDRGTLKGVAQSILDHPAASTLVPGGIKLPTGTVEPGEIFLSEASSALGSSVALPNTSLANREHLVKVLADPRVNCPRPISRSRPCVLWVSTRSLTLIYERPAPWPHSRGEYALFAHEMLGGAVIDLDGVAAVASARAGAIYFTVGDTRVVVGGGHLPLAKLEKIARSIVERSRSK